MALGICDTTTSLLQKTVLWVLWNTRAVLRRFVMERYGQDEKALGNILCSQGTVTTFPGCDVMLLPLLVDYSEILCRSLFPLQVQIYLQPTFNFATTKQIYQECKFNLDRKASVCQGGGRNGVRSQDTIERQADWHGMGIGRTIENSWQRNLPGLLTSDSCSVCEFLRSPPSVQ